MFHKYPFHTWYSNPPQNACRSTLPHSYWHSSQTSGTRVSSRHNTAQTVAMIQEQLSNSVMLAHHRTSTKIVVFGETAKGIGNSLLSLKNSCGAVHHHATRCSNRLCVRDRLIHKDFQDPLSQNHIFSKSCTHPALPPMSICSMCPCGK